MCPGGYVVNASTEAGGIAVNGMSYNSRNSGIANSAIIVSVGKKEFDLNNPLSGILYQKQLESYAYHLASGNIPKQLYGDFKNNKASTQ